MKKIFSNSLIGLLVFGLLGAWITKAEANPEHLKMYKSVYPDEKPKCSLCHASEKPKKDEGLHELNDYGKKIKALKEAPDNKMSDEDIYKTIGKKPTE